MALSGHDSLGARRELPGRRYCATTTSRWDAPPLSSAIARACPTRSRSCSKIFLRHENGRSVTVDHLGALVAWLRERRSDQGSRTDRRGC